MKVFRGRTDEFFWYFFLKKQILMHFFSSLAYIFLF